jgi:hypothetical protein
VPGVTATPTTRSGVPARLDHGLVFAPGVTPGRDRVPARPVAADAVDDRCREFAARGDVDSGRFHAERSRANVRERTHALCDRR